MTGNDLWNKMLAKGKQAIDLFASSEMMDEEDSQKLFGVFENLGKIFMPNRQVAQSSIPEVQVPDINLLITEVSNRLSSFSNLVEEPSSYEDLDDEVGASIEALIFAIVAYDKLDMLRPGRGARYFYNRLKKVFSGDSRHYQHAYVQREILVILSQLKAAVKQ